MKTLKMILVFVLMGLLFANCSSTKEVRKTAKEEQKIENTLEKQAKQLANKLENEGYQISDLNIMEDAIFKYLKCKLNPGSIAEEVIVYAPTDNIGKTKCIVNIKSRVAKIVCDSIRYRVDEAVGGDEVSQEYADKFFSASEHLGVLNLGAPDASFTLYRKKNKNITEYRMFAVYSGNNVDNIISNGVKFGNQIKNYIDKGFSK
jgi:hypothetical protein